MSNPGLPRGIRSLFRLPWRSAARVQRDVDDELRFHIEMRAAEMIHAGVPPDDAVAEAWRQFGDPDDVRRHALSVSVTNRYRTHARELLGGFTQDLRYAARQLRRAPLFAAVAVLTIALGIGANSAIYSVVHHLVLAPLPYPGGNRIVQLMRTRGEGRIMLATTREQLDAWRARAHSVEEITTAYHTQVSIRDGEAHERVTVGVVQPNLMHFLGLRPFLGRDFAPNDTRPGAEPVVILGYGLWQRRFGAEAAAVGKILTLDDTARTILGVAPPALSVPMNENESVALWLPLSSSSPALNVLAFGRLRSGVSVNDASRELSAIARTLPSQPGWSSAAEEIRAMRPQDFLGTGFERGLLLLFGAVGVVLLIACANVANLLLVKSWGRQRELAVRAALGAGRSRLARQLLTECLTLSLIGGVLGLVLAWSGLHVFRAMRPAGLEDLDGVHIESAVLVWTTTLAIGTGVTFGLFPTLFAMGRLSGDALRTGARSAGSTRAARRLRNALVVGELALSVVLLVGAGLLVRSFLALERIELGFDPHGLASFTIRYGPDTPKGLWRTSFVDVLRRARSLPGIEGAAFASDAPPEMGVSFAELQSDQEPPRVPIKLTAFELAGPEFFHVARLGLRGRTFSGDSSMSGAADEVIVSESLAQRLWPDADALGRRLRVGSGAPWQTVVGVAHNVAAPGRSGDFVDLQLYRPITLGDFPSATILVRSGRSIDVLAPAMRQIVAQVDPRLELWHTASSETEISGMLAGPRFSMALLGALALAALVLSAVGLYGVIAYAVSQRTREIGVRVALGAEPRDIGRLVMREGVVLAVIGLTIGLVSAAVAGRTLQNFLYGVRHTDPATYAAIAALLAAVALIASYLPARRAMRVDPVVALSAE